MTELVLCGLNYHNVPVAIRERFTIPESCLKYALAGLKQLPHIKEAAILSTCNRTEVYAVVSDIVAGMKELESFFTSAQSVADHNALKPNFRLLREDVVLHLLRVASGLDSMVLGEGQIMHQVKTAHQAALTAGTALNTIDSLFKFALNCGKRVRAETSMGRRAVSISSAAVELARNLLGNLKDKTILVIGAGKMGQICLKLLLSESQPGTVWVANRTAERIEKFQANNIRNLDRLKIVPDFAERHDYAACADLVIVASSASDHILTSQMLAAARRNVRSPLCLIDIAVPRNIDPSIADLADICLHNTDDLSAIVNHNLAEREALVSDAEKIVFAVLQEFQDWQRNLMIVPTIAGLRQKIEAIRLEHLERSGSTNQLEELGSTRQELEEVSRAIINQILHHPTKKLKTVNNTEILKQQAEALRLLFDLDPLTIVR